MAQGKGRAGAYAPVASESGRGLGSAGGDEEAGGGRFPSRGRVRSNAGEDDEASLLSNDSQGIATYSEEGASPLEADGYDGYTMDQAVERMGFGKFHWQLLLLCGVGYFAEITELVIVAFVASAIQRDFGLSEVEYGILGSSSFVGMTAGAVFWGYVSDRFGRQVSFSLTVWMTFVGGFLSALAPNYWTLLLLRFTAAFGIGGMLPVDYTVFLEFLPNAKRGSRIVLVDAIGVIPALFLSSTVSYAFSGKEDIKWRWVLAIVSIPVGIMAVLRRHVPESPRYHLANGDVSKAQEILESVAAMNGVDLPGTHLVDKKAGGSDGMAADPIVKSNGNPRGEGSSAPSPTRERRPSWGQGEDPEGRDGAGSELADREGAGGSPSKGGPGGSATSRPWHKGRWSVGKGAGKGYGDKMAQLFKGPVLARTTPRLWVMWFCTQFSSAGLVFALPMLFEESFDVAKRKIALDLLWGVFGLIPGLAVAYYAVERSRKYSLAAYYAASSASVVGLMLTTVGPMKNEGLAVCFSIFIRGTMEGCFAILNTTTIESYPTLIRTSGMGTAQIFDHIAGMGSPLFFSIFNGRESLRPLALAIYAGANLVAMLPTLTLPRDYAGVAVHTD